MKTKKSGIRQNGHSSAPDLLAKAVAAQKIADVARKHMKMLKSEYKQARKSFKQAKKAAKRASKAVKAAEELLQSRIRARANGRKRKPAHHHVSTARPVNSRPKSHAPVFPKLDPAAASPSVAFA